MKIFDAHFHIINPDYPIFENNGFIPDPFVVEDYLARLSEYGLEPAGGVVVSGSFQEFDQTYVEPAINALGKDYVAVTQIPVDTSEEELNKLHEIGVRGIRFNLYRGLEVPLEEIERFSRYVYELHGWNTQFYLDLGKLDQASYDMLLTLPKITIDHLGMEPSGNERLLELASRGARIKVTGFGRIGHTQDELVATLKEIYAKYPKALMFGTDLPSTRARTPFSIKDVELLQSIFDEEALEAIMYKNAYEWYVL